MPKFTVSSTHNLNAPLRALGLASAFSGLANFRGITTDEGEHLLINQIMQKAFIEVSWMNNV